MEMLRNGERTRREAFARMVTLKEEHILCGLNDENGQRCKRISWKSPYSAGRCGKNMLRPEYAFIQE
jgi:hypothetical protein